MEAICSSETSVDTQRTTRRYVTEDGTLHLLLNAISEVTLHLYQTPFYFK
jgi:hypothetical protein